MDKDVLTCCLDTLVHKIDIFAELILQAKDLNEREVNRDGIYFTLNDFSNELNFINKYMVQEDDSTLEGTETSAPMVAVGLLNGLTKSTPQDAATP